MSTNSFHPGIALLCAAHLLFAQQQEPTTVEKLAAAARESIVIITVKGRDGETEGIGTGFIVSEDGLVATNRHVLGEARPISVELDGGVFFRVTEIHATASMVDLAIIRIRAEGLTALPLGDSGKLIDGQRVVALGNPQGMAHSVVSGVVSAVRDLGGQQMIQLAIPIEPGNSGGPVLDEQGRVVGILTLKSAITHNLGFALGVDMLKPLLENPNPVPIENWLTIGAIDADTWDPRPVGHWRQRAGRVLAVPQPQSVEGRSTCLREFECPATPYEVAVSIHAEGSHAGLLLGYQDDTFHTFSIYDGHAYLARFGMVRADTRESMQDRRCPSYRPGTWNHLKVKVEADRIVCFLNGEEVFESPDTQIPATRHGLIRFAAEPAAFRDFQIAARIDDNRLDPAIATKINTLLDSLPSDEISDDVVNTLADDADAAAILLDARAWLLLNEARRMRELAEAVNARKVQQQLNEELSQDEPDIDLIHAALLLAKLDNPDLRLEVYRQEVADMAAAIKAKLADDADEATRLQQLISWMFEENGFHGSRSDYYNRANSYLNEVIDDREGIPITLSVLFIEFARRLDLDVVGVGMPGHFIVRYEPAEGEPQLLDVFNGAQAIDRNEAALIVRSITGMRPLDEHLAATSKQDIITRMLHNLLGTARIDDDELRARRYIDTIIAITGGDIGR